MKKVIYRTTKIHFFEVQIKTKNIKVKVPLCAFADAEAI